MDLILWTYIKLSAAGDNKTMRGSPHSRRSTNRLRGTHASPLNGSDSSFKPFQKRLGRVERYKSQKTTLQRLCLSYRRTLARTSVKGNLVKVVVKCPSWREFGCCEKWTVGTAFLIYIWCIFDKSDVTRKKLIQEHRGRVSEWKEKEKVARNSEVCSVSLLFPCTFKSS